MQVFCKTYKFLFSWISSKTISAGCPKKVNGAFKLLSTSPWEQFEEVFFEKFLHLLWTFFRIISSKWARKFFAGLSKQHSLYLWNHFGEKTVLENKWKFSSFLDSEQEVFGFLSSFSTGMLDLHFTCPKHLFNEEQFFSNFVFHFWTLSDFFDQFSQKK